MNRVRTKQEAAACRGSASGTAICAAAEVQTRAASGEGGTAADAPDWVYLDGDGIEQGPFPQSLMAQWYAGGALPDDLAVRTASDTTGRYNPLGGVVKSW